MKAHYSEHFPASPLDRHIECYWFYECSDPGTGHDHVHLVVPDNTIELIISDDMMVRRQLNSINEPVRCKTHLAGVKTIPQLVTIGKISMMGIRFRPHSLRQFTCFNIKDSVDESLDPRLIFGDGFTSFSDKILEEKTISGKIMLANHYFMGLYKKYLSADPLLDVLINRIVLQKGMLQIAELADEFSVSGKTIERKFTSSLGMNPKKYTRLIRFRNVLEDYFLHGNEKLSEIAYNNGFFDQMHFIRETASFTGSTPGKYFREHSAAGNIQIMMLQYRHRTG